MKKRSKIGDKGSAPIYIAIVGVSLAAFVVALLLLSNVFKTETYYVLNKNVPAQTLITPEMVSPVVTSEGSTPPNSIGLAEIQEGNIYSQYPLSSGDILSKSSIGELDGIEVGVPDSWVITSFTVDSSSTVGGRIERGSYFDIMATSEKGTFYLFSNVLALDVSSGGESKESDAEGNIVSSGPTTEITVGMSPANAAKLQDSISRYGQDAIKLTLSPRQNDYAAPRLADYEGVFSHNPEDGVDNAGEGTDSTFVDVKRDESGRPIDKVEGDTQGNSKVPSEGAPSVKNDNSSSGKENLEGKPSDGGQ